jgi:hypothetical protein
MIKPQYSQGEVYAALCLWEAMLEARPGHESLSSVWESKGTVAMRDLAIELAATVSAKANFDAEQEA